MKTYTYPSKSGGGDHTVRVYPDGRITCTCRGFDSPNKCWHYKKHLQATPQQTTIDLQAIDREQPHWLNGFVEPMLASVLPEGLTLAHYATPEYILEEKIDGHRLIIEVRDDGYTAWSRAGNTRDLPLHLVEAIKRLPPVTLDSELHIPGGTSTDVTDTAKQHLLRIKLFDVIRIGEHSAMDRPGTYRRLLLETAGERLDRKGPVTVIPQFDVEQSTLDAIWHAGLEGVVVKRRAAVYQSGKRSKDWIKFKKPGACEVIITGFEAGKSGPHSTIVGVDRHGIEVKVKSLNEAWRADFRVHAASYIGRTLVISHQGKAARGRYKSAMADHILFEGERS